MNKHKVIFLDWNKTLSDSKFWGVLSPNGDRLSKQLIKIEEVLFNKENNLVVPWMLGKTDLEEVCNFISDKANIDPELLKTELIYSCTKMNFVNDGVKNQLKEIKKRGIKLVIATDNMDTFSKYTYPVFQKDGIFDGMINSYEIGCFKYDSDGLSLPFFDNYLKANGLNYGEVVLIDDSIDKKGNFNMLGFNIINITDEMSINDALALYEKT